MSAKFDLKEINSILLNETPDHVVETNLEKFDMESISKKKKKRSS